MRFHIRFFGFAAAMLLGASAAHAGDLAIPAPPAVETIRLQAPPPAEFRWTGCHVGLHAGFGFAGATTNGQFIDNRVPSTFGAPTAVAIIIPGLTSDGIGAIGGFQGGCDIHIARRLVLGAQADISGMSISSTVNGTTGNATLIGFPIPAPTNFVNNGIIGQKVNFTATATGRLGYAFETSGRGLIYLKGGAAWLGARYSFSGTDTTTACIAFAGGACTAFSAPLVQPFNFTASETKLGWTIGLGSEFAVTRHWSAWLEYDFLSFPSHNVAFTDVALPTASVPVSAQVHEVKFGVNYLIGNEQGWRY